MPFGEQNFSLSHTHIFMIMSSLELPHLDMSHPILLPSTLSSLSQACKEWGFFHIINHGISEELFTKLATLSNQVFQLPSQLKLNLGPSSPINTYTPHFIASSYFESLRVSGPNFFSSAKSTIDALFQTPPTEFCELLEDYGSKMMELSKRIITILLNCLGDDFETKYLHSEFNKCHGYLRINNYSPPEMLELNETTEGLGMHTDMSCITILHQDEVGGLQVRSKEGQWMDIIPSEGKLVVNIGDLLQAWSNGRFRSSQHRVVLRKLEARLSIAFFWCFEDEKVIWAPEELVEEKGRNYRAFLCIDYMKFRENSEKGRFDKVGYTVDGFAANRAFEVL